MPNTLEHYVYRDRKMMKWLPFGALTEQGDYLQELFAKRNRQEKPTLLSDAENEMNYILEEAIAMSLPIKVTYFEQYTYHTISGLVTKVDQMHRQLTINGTRLSAQQITDIRFQ
ncbi:MAG: YolD-like family protein [Candidatus Izemoplasma sp.]|nr:YolD-like family protein [Candidatus Izemoplasma sp.]